MREKSKSFIIIENAAFFCSFNISYPINAIVQQNKESPEQAPGY
jgi:hypothetical protein